ncbi:hypothetical protein SMACR_03102 [Sordaria macrospora]|uniref:WGS project CABT00000000 data, contig 2.7 n=2 Tax=Sordaria macrospora TaxID=5147 RepID=F7VU81_SORMK|nr:uncharacterized protein SMAC_03102 [Sordaria macrospora k-hell]KAA8628063.1 hypothetical protein SMACR_03102 [Sordaria macrospora]CCC09069.1 unnamed protein product [Sordaria macrospora k-hell]
MPGRHRAYTTEHSAKGFKWFPWKREKKVVKIEPGQVWSDWVSSEDGTYFYRARRLADGTWGDYEYTEGYYMGGYAEGYGADYEGGIEIPQEKEYHPAVAVSPWKLPGETAVIMPESPEVMEDPEPRYAEIAESEPIGEFSAADEEEQHPGTTTNATSVSGDDVSVQTSDDDGYRESEPLPTVQEAEPMVFTREPEPFRPLSPAEVPSLRREYKPKRRHTTGADTSVPTSSHYRPRVPHRHTFSEGQQKEGHKDSHSHDHHHHHKRTKSHDPSHKQPLLFSIFYAVTKTHGGGPQTRRMPSTSPHRSSTHGKKKPHLTVPTASETTVVVPLDTGAPSVIAPPGKATITKTKKFNSKIKSEKEMKVDSKKMIKGWLAGMQEPAATTKTAAAGGDKQEKGKGGKEGRGRRMTK